MNDELFTDVLCEECGQLFSIVGLVKEPYTCEECLELLEEQDAVDF